MDLEKWRLDAAHSERERERERPGGELDNWAELCFDCVELVKNGV